MNDVLTQFKVVPSNSVAAPNVEANDHHVGLRSYEMTCVNMPLLRFSYMKYATKQEKVVIILDLPGGSGDYGWEFNDNGDAITIFVNWSQSLYDVSDLFRSYLNAGVITLDHPKLHAMQNESLRQGFSSKNIPQSQLYVELGKRVHKDDGTWNVDEFQDSGKKILLFEFSGFQEESLKTEKRGKFV